MAPSKVILLACGSFNPPTNMHLRMFELARDNLNRLGQYLVVGGIVSPVHEAYGKKELIPGTFRCEMLKLALKSSDWIQISDWECSQETWSRTRRVLQYHQNMLNSVLNDDRDSPNNNQRSDLENGYDYSNWITNDIRNTEGPVQIKLLCGADLLESFATPGLWADEDIETIIGQHGIVVITRQGSDPRRFIYESDILTKYQHNIIIVTEWITNDVSSTKVRRALRRQESVKYLIEDSVIEFIRKHKLYGTTMKNDIKHDSNQNQNLCVPPSGYILTPSPSDINMMSASTSGNDIYLTLNPIPDPTLNSPLCPNHQQEPILKSFNAPDEKEFSICPLENNDGIERGLGVAVIPGDEMEFDEKKKVGFLKLENSEVVKAPGEGETLAEEGKPHRRPSKKGTKLGSSLRKSGKGEGKVNDGEKKVPRENIRLKRSKSDAVMSTTREGGETTSVKIQFTEDGIKVISDKESIV